MKYKITFLIIGIILYSCSQISPSGFWADYKSNQITEKKNDEGPWGGTLMIHWAADQNSAFNISDIKEIASQNDWKLIDSVKYPKTDLQKMTADGKTTIRLPLENFTPEPKRAGLKSEPMPRWITTDFTLYRFKTDWLLFEPGTDDSTEENGFILLSSDNKEMTVYHIWGE